MSTFVRRNLVYAWLTLISIALAFMAFSRAASGPEVRVFDEISVHRLNVIEPDGKPRVVISNRERMPGLFWGGKEYRHHTRDDAGFLFFNREGDEVGGLTFDAVREGDQYSAHGGLMFDQYKQDQTVGVVYNDDNGQRRAGLRVWERPDESLFPLIELSDKAAGAATDEEREAVRAEMREIARKMGPQGERLFVGKAVDDAVVRLSDKQGRPRLVLKVDGSGEPSVELLDEAGKVVRRIPEH